MFDYYPLFVSSKAVKIKYAFLPGEVQIENFISILVPQKMLLKKTGVQTSDTAT